MLQRTRRSQPLRRCLTHGFEKRAIVEDIAKDIPFQSEKDHERDNFLLPPQLSTPGLCNPEYESQVLYACYHLFGR